MGIAHLDGKCLLGFTEGENGRDTLADFDASLERELRGEVVLKAIREDGAYHVD